MTELNHARRGSLISQPLLNQISSEEQMKIAASDLINIFNANRQLILLGNCLEQTQESGTDAQYSLLTLEKCAQIDMELDKERRSHAEELRLINQDINHLEDILKRVESDHCHHRSQLAQRMIHLKVNFQSFQNLANNLLDQRSLQPSDTQIDITKFETNENDNGFENRQLTWEEFMPEIPCSAFTFESAVMPEIPRPTSINFAPPKILFKQPTPCAPVTPSQLAMWNMFVRTAYNINVSNRDIGQPSHSAKAFTFNPMIGPIAGNSEKFTSSFKEQSTKMKICLNCEQKIHRNAPVCPFAKLKLLQEPIKEQKRRVDKHPTTSGGCIPVCI